MKNSEASTNIMYCLYIGTALQNRKYETVVFCFFLIATV